MQEPFWKKKRNQMQKSQLQDHYWQRTALKTLSKKCIRDSNLLPLYIYIYIYMYVRMYVQTNCTSNNRIVIPRIFFFDR